VAQGNNKKPTVKPTSKGIQPARKPSSSRQSVAAARVSSGNNNRTQLIIGAVAIAVIIVIVVAGVIFTQQQSAVQGEGYGASTQSVASANADGVVNVVKPGATPKATIDIYEDALCPICAQFEKQFGQQINQAIDEGSVAVNYHMLTFLDPKSFTGTYSTRAAAALLCVAQQDGAQPGLYLGFHSALFNPDNQPEESGTEDLSNDQLAALATSNGASADTATCISTGANVAAAKASATTSTATLSAATNGQVGTPTVLKDGAPVPELTADWLSKLLAQS
jgi:protein-disulfide isomerase